MNDGHFYWLRFVVNITGKATSFGFVLAYWITICQLNLFSMTHYSFKKYGKNSGNIFYTKEGRLQKKIDQEFQILL